MPFVTVERVYFVNKHSSAKIFDEGMGWLAPFSRPKTRQAPQVEKVENNISISYVDFLLRDLGRSAYIPERGRVRSKQM